MAIIAIARQAWPDGNGQMLRQSDEAISKPAIESLIGVNLANISP